MMPITERKIFLRRLLKIYYNLEKQLSNINITVTFLVSPAHVPRPVILKQETYV